MDPLFIMHPIPFMGASENASLLMPPKKNCSLEEITEEHERAVDETKRLCWRIAGLAAFISFTMTMRLNVFVLFGQSLGYEGNASYIIAVTLYLDWFVSAIFSLVESSLADDYGFNKFLFLSVLLNVVLSFFESISWNLIILAIVWVISDQPVSALSKGLITKLLPIYHSQQYIGRFYQWFTLGYIAGPIISGLIAYFMSYRMVFIIATIIGALCMIYFMLFISERERRFVTMQLGFTDHYIRHSSVSEESTDETNVLGESDSMSGDLDVQVWDSAETIEAKWIDSRNFRFPVCLNQIREERPELVEIDGSSEVTKYEWFLVLNYTFQNSLLLASETIFATLFTVYMNDVFGASIITSTGMLSLLSLFVIIGMLTMEYINKTVLGRLNGEDSNNKVVLMTSQVISNVIMLIFVLLLFPNNNDTMYWSYCAICGFFFGIALFATQAMQVQIQPLHLTGRVAGIELFITNNCRGIAILVVSLLWHVNNRMWFWYVQAVISSVVLFCIFAAVAAQVLRNAKQ